MTKCDQLKIVTHLYLGSVLVSWIVWESLTETAARIFCSIAIGRTA